MKTNATIKLSDAGIDCITIFTCAAPVFWHNSCNWLLHALGKARCYGALNEFWLFDWLKPLFPAREKNLSLFWNSNYFSGSNQCRSVGRGCTTEKYVKSDFASMVRKTTNFHNFPRISTNYFSIQRRRHKSPCSWRYRCQRKFFRNEIVLTWFDNFRSWRACFQLFA